METIEITRPDDWHVHLRDESYLLDTVPASATHYGRALVMPNLNPPVTTLQSLLDYRQRIIDNNCESRDFSPLMTFYLNNTVDADELIAAKHHPFIVGGKLYPAGATTNSSAGATCLESLYPLFDIMQQQNLVLQIHGELARGDIFARERLFIERNLKPIVAAFPKLRIVLEHISTKSAVDFITTAPDCIGATITPHHLLYNRNHLLAGGLRPHYYCLPILKTGRDQRALQAAVLSGNRKFFAGTDSAPHIQTNKESACGCAGIYCAPFSLSFYAEFFAQHNRLPLLNNFMSRYGADFYQLPYNSGHLILAPKKITIPARLPLGHDWVVPMGAGESLQWSVCEYF